MEDIMKEMENNNIQVFPAALFLLFYYIIHAFWLLWIFLVYFPAFTVSKRRNIADIFFLIFIMILYKAIFWDMCFLIHEKYQINYFPVIPIFLIINYYQPAHMPCKYEITKEKYLPYIPHKKRENGEIILRMEI